MCKRPQSSPEIIQQVCAIPYRRQPTDGGMLEFCLITSLVKRRWIFPKGIIESSETPAQAALKEVWEEAGLRGIVDQEPLGHFKDQKWGCELQVQVLTLAVTEAMDVWPEMDQRQRQWATADDATTRLKRSELRAFLQLAQKRLQA